MFNANKMTYEQGKVSAVKSDVISVKTSEGNFFDVKVVDADASRYRLRNATKQVCVFKLGNLNFFSITIAFVENNNLAL